MEHGASLSSAPRKRPLRPFLTLHGYYVIGPSLAKPDTCASLKAALSRASVGILKD
jgi:hypothetical protein